MGGRGVAASPGGSGAGWIAGRDSSWVGLAVDVSLLRAGMIGWREAAIDANWPLTLKYRDFELIGVFLAQPAHGSRISLEHPLPN